MSNKKFRKKTCISRMTKYIALHLAVFLTITLFPIKVIAQTNEGNTIEDSSSENGEVFELNEEQTDNSILTDDTIQSEDLSNETEAETILESETVQTLEQDESVWLAASTDQFSDHYNNFSAKYFANILIEHGNYTVDQIKGIISENGSEITIKIEYGNEKIFSLLSRTIQGTVTLGDTQDVFSYTEWIIKCFEDSTGNIYLTDDFEGLGDLNYPFAGKLYGQGVTIVTKKTLFKALDAKAELNGMNEKNIRWKGTASQPILAGVLFVDGSNHTISMPLNGSNSFAPYIGILRSKSGVTPGEITLPSLDYSHDSNEEIDNSVYPGDAGLLCGKMEEGTKLKFEGVLKLPNDSFSIDSTEDLGSFVGKMESDTSLSISSNSKIIGSLSGNNVGGLVGSMKENAEMIVSKPISITNNLNGTVNTGGLVGYMELGSNIQLNADINIVKAGNDSAPVYNSMNASQSAGGIVGEINTVNGSIIFNGNSKIVLDDSESKIIGEINAGGLYGNCVASGNLEPLNSIEIGKSKIPNISVGTTSVSDYYISTVGIGGNGNCGGLFGTLDLTGNGNKCIINNQPLYVRLYSAGSTSVVGGIVGNLIGNRQNALVVSFSAESNGEPSTNPQVIVNTKPESTTQKPKYLGGVVGYQNATVDVSNIFAGFPYASQSKGTDSNYYTGGLSAYVCDNMLLKANNIRIIFAGYTNDDHNGGVVGYSGKGSVVCLKGNLLLRDCPLQSVAGCGQIVANQDCSLVYGPEISKVTRWGQGMEVDDIGSYGEIYRVAGFLEVSDDYTTAFNNVLTSKDGVYILNNELDYACLALAWQSRGVFNTVSGINKDNWQGLKNCSVKLGNDIVLTGKGIGGLSRDIYSSEDVFAGSLDGNGKTITLDIGAIYAQAGTSGGDGRIYFHNSTGLFAGLSSKANVQNLTLAGSIRVSNNRLTVNANNESANMKTGALAGLYLCEGNGGRLTNVSTSVNIVANSNAQTPDAPFYIGGLFGLSYGSGDATLTLDSNLGSNISQAISKSTKVITGQCFHMGGAIGAIDSECTKIKIECNGTVISGEIKRTGDSVENFYEGGLIGTIFPSNNSSREIKLENIKVGDNTLSKTFSVSGGADLRMGGVLGGIWADTDVYVTGLKVDNATLTTPGTAKLGGLVYRASGKWTVSNVDLTGLKINALNAEALGLIVCQGGPYKEPLGYNSANATSLNTYKDMGGLYLIMEDNWDSCYKVPSNQNISFNTDGGVFDEFVAYTAYAYFSEANKNSPSYSITSNSGGIISLKTNNGIVNMTEGNRNMYENRTDVVKTTNLYSRYYYNLPSVMESSNINDDEYINTPEELLIWSVNWYSADNLKKYFPVGGSVIGGSDYNSKASFDMANLSYYPICITDSSITLQNANVKFYNQEIEGKVTNSKSTRGDNEDHTQHYTMQCGLFFDFSAEKKEYSEAKNYTITVNGVSFAGTIGKINGQSGALLCGKVSGRLSGNLANCNLVLADSDVINKAITLNDITVDSTDTYKPVLIGRIMEYATLQANYITVGTQSKVAGSSLIGDVGHSTATGLAISFDGTIKLKSDDNSLFTSATLLNSLQYQGNTPTTYHFIKSKDWQSDGNHLNNVTYGYEISGSVEYLDEQYEYFDGGFVSSVNPNATESGNFSSYLPYVANSPAKDSGGTYTVENGYHELEINVKPANLISGCGTYGDPYVLNDAKLLKSIAKYLEHPEKTINGWQVRYPSSNNYHTSESSDLILEFDSINQIWSNEKTINEIRNYLSNAYYVVEDELSLVSFSGLGTEDYPFSGVIQGKDETVKNIRMIGNTQALVRYSNGSVIRNLNISLEQNAPLRSTAPEMLNNARTANRAPKNFFGGVIGCVMGGDNIIENVNVSTNNGHTPYYFPEGYDDFAHLVPIGGYVGVVAGGGVIFRGTISESTGISGTENQLYCNNIIGRVLGGYAFYEGNGDVDVPDNSDKNYKINKISVGTHLTWNSTSKTITINDSEGLLLLSAIINSGAGSYENSLAYKTGYGVSRNAQYNKIGKSADEASADYSLANSQQAKPYLLNSIFNQGDIFKVCQDGAQSGITLVLANNLDMKSYGNGYRGLSARYISNAGFTGTTTVSPYTVVTRLKSFDGNSKTVSGITMNVKEYDDDDFHAASIGGIFNIAWTNENTGGGSTNANNSGSGYDSVLAKNLTLKECYVELNYIDKNIDKNGSYVRQAKNAYFTQKDGISTVATGGFAGTINNLNGEGMTSIKNNYLFTNIRLEGTASKQCIIYGPNSAGGLIGATGMGSSGYPGRLLTNGLGADKTKLGPSFLNCSYENATITGYLVAGGIVGCSATGYDNLESFGTPQDGETAGCFATYTITDDNLVFAKNSTVQTQSSGGICGGVFGGIGMRGRINESATKNSQPMVNYLTGLSIIQNSDNVSVLRFDNVKLYAELAFDDYIYYGSSSINGVDKGKTIAVGGCIGRISHANPVKIYKVQMGVPDSLASERCQIKIKNTKTIDVTSKYAGGLVGYGYTTKEMVVQDCAVYNTDIFGDTTGGFVSLAKVSDLKVGDSIIYGCTVDGITRGSSIATGSGGITGYSEGNVNLFNIQVKDTSITKDGIKSNNGVARLVVQKAANKEINAAAISVFASNSSITLPDNDVVGTYTGYVAYADYLGTNTAPEIGNINDKFPYVAVNPSYNLPGVNVRLTGDTVKNIGSYKTIAEGIWVENISSQLLARNNYTKYSFVSTGNIPKPNITNLNSAIGEGPDNLPVLLVKSGDSKSITDYLDIVTNGGYTAASKDTVNKVIFNATPYYLTEGQDSFSTENWDSLHSGSPSITTADNGRKLIVSGTNYDNTRHRFTLVEATFETAIGNYTVSIPVVVQRKLEYVYMATLSNGNEFNSEAYKNIDSHLLESTGIPFSAYLTINYNQSYNNGIIEKAEYDWKSYIESGGNLVAMDKVLKFTQGLPLGTEFTLIDCQHNNQAYYYCNKEETDSVPLSSFLKNPKDSNTSFGFSMADILGITREEKANPEGNFLLLQDSNNATILINGEYFRPAVDGDNAEKRYNLVYPTNLSTDLADENYYLLITVPKQQDTFAKNGILQLEIKNYGVPTNGTKIRRFDRSKDDEDSTESTYNISSGYIQSLSTGTENRSINLNDSNNKMHIEITDTITFSRGQAYGNKDKLYVKFMASLLQTRKDTNVQEKGISAGTAGKVLFFIQDTDGYYYVPNDNVWSRLSPVGEAEAVPEKYIAASYNWLSDGGSLSLPVSANGHEPLDLSGVRNVISDNKNVDSKIIIKAIMKEDISPLYTGEEDSIPMSKDGLDNYAKLHYVARLSTQKHSLDYSTIRAAIDDQIHYYRYSSYKAILSMDAGNIDQLGINPLQLVDSYRTYINGKDASLIDLNAELDLSDLQDIDDLLQKTNSVTFDIAVQRRQGENYNNLENTSDFIVFKWNNSDDQGYSMTINKSDSETWNSIFDGTKFTFPIKAFVYVDKNNYANYKIKLDVTFLDSSGNNVLDDGMKDCNDANVIYTYACIKPIFYTPSLSVTN